MVEAGRDRWGWRERREEVWRKGEEGVDRGGGRDEVGMGVALKASRGRRNGWAGGRGRRRGWRGRIGKGGGGGGEMWTWWVGGGRGERVAG
ncbi:hypothetical protein KP509_35G062700 [Ceratopteris richardii]|uniref:Uncharacterized protein n=1 Tax=Ceratopteris richardii TaxID=49495 RepID=A0A8T2QGW8_CERRI|nr:hypothetical protein KP509_35G062700 [Ceratopteris richardii]